MKTKNEMCPDCGRSKATSGDAWLDVPLLERARLCATGVAPPGYGDDAWIACAELTIARLRARVAELESEVEQQAAEVIRLRADAILVPLSQEHEAAVAVACGLLGKYERENAWTECAERMPEEEQPVWIFEDGWSVAEAYRELGTWRAPEGWRHTGMKPTHWMPRYVQPRPAPPPAEPRSEASNPE